MKKRTLSTAAALLFMTVLSIPAFAEEYDLANGSIEVTTDDEGIRRVTQGSTIDKEQTTPTVITQTGTAATQNTITITAEENQTTEVTLKHVNIDMSDTGQVDPLPDSPYLYIGSAAVATSGKGNVVIELEKKNTVKSGAFRGGVNKKNDGHLTITAADNDGSLTAVGGGYGAGIGCGTEGNGNNITISGGNVTAIGGCAGAGIGGGVNGIGTDIRVWGDVQLRTQGGVADQNHYRHGSGASIGNGGEMNGVSGKDVAPNVDELTAKGKIEYYAPGVDMETAEPTTTHGTHEHDLDDGVVTTLPTCTEKGVITYTCKVGNNFVVTKEIPPQHDYGTPEVWKKTETEHYKVCQRTSCSDIPGSIKERDVHTYENATSQVCMVCNYDRGHQHSLTLVSKKEASCTEAGHEPYYTCSGCDSLFGNALGNVSVDRADLTLPATGHKYDGYLQDAEGHWQQCSVCGEATAKESHHFNGDTCTTCGYQKPETEKTETNTDTETKIETNTETGTTTTTTRSSGGSHHDSAEVTDNSQKGRWVQDEKGWYFRRNDGGYPKSGWSKLYWLGKEYWYYFDENGYMKLGWLDVSGSRYYMNPIIGTNSGKMLTGWQQIDQKWYYFSTEAGTKEGSLLRNAVTPDNYRVDENGIWQQ